MRHCNFSPLPDASAPRTTPMTKHGLIIRTLLLLPCCICVQMLTSVRLFFKQAFACAHFRAKCNARVHSPEVSGNSCLGKRVSIARGVFVGPNVQIGDYTYISRHATIQSGKIGKYCSIGPRVSIGPPEHPLKWFSLHPATYDPAWGIVESRATHDTKPPPILGNDIWIGLNAVVLRGVAIGNGAVIGAGAVVTRDVPPYSIVAGVPARVIGHRLCASATSALDKEQWWNDSDILLSTIERWRSRSSHQESLSTDRLSGERS
jgi:acetyltransferase-like isoleucine patch superfamily enzyme